MLQTEMLSLEQEKNSQLSPVSFDELSNLLQKYEIFLKILHFVTQKGNLLT